MPLFHLFTVKPVEVQDHELPRVQYGDYYLFAADLQAAWDTIKEWVGVADAAEVWGIAAGDHFQITPQTRLHQQEQANQHRHWAQVQDRYRLIHSGPESLEQWSDRRLDERMRDKTTEAETRRKFALYFTDLQSSLKAEGEGAVVDKQTEWENFISHGIAEGTLPERAKQWACPRSLAVA